MAAAEQIIVRHTQKAWWFRDYHWTDTQEASLRLFCEVSTDPEKAGDALGRTAYAVAYRARENGLTLPVLWRKSL
jgi:hypothetical protein